MRKTGWKYKISYSNKWSIKLTYWFSYYWQETSLKCCKQRKLTLCYAWIYRMMLDFYVIRLGMFLVKLSERWILNECCLPPLCAKICPTTSLSTVQPQSINPGILKIMVTLLKEILGEKSGGNSSLILILFVVYSVCNV